MKLTFLGGADAGEISSTLVEIAGHRVLVDFGIPGSDVGGVEAVLRTRAARDRSGTLIAGHVSRRDIPVFAPSDTLASVELFSDGVRATFHPAGPKADAASILLESPVGTVLFSSDVALPEVLAVLDAQTVRLDAVVVDLTGGVGPTGPDEQGVASELARGLQTLEPENAIFVGGDLESREALASAVQRHGVERAHLPEVGDEVDVAHKRRRRRQPPPDRENRRASSAALDEYALPEVAAVLVTRDGPHAWYTIDDLLKTWGATGVVDDVDERNRLRTLLTSADSPFVRDPKKIFRWRVRADATGDAKGSEESAWRARVRQRMEEPAARHHAKTLFPDDSGLYQVSAFPRTFTLVLAFNFPIVARKRFVAQFDRLATETGWSVKVRDESHQGALGDAAVAALPEGVRAVRHASIFLDERTVALRVEGEPATPDALERAADAFRELTGFTLRFEASKANASPALLAVAADGGRLDQSSAQQRARAAFPPEAGLYRVSAILGTGTLVLAFHFPHTVRARFPESFESLATETGWTVTVREEPNLGALSDAAEAALPEGSRALKRPSVRHDLRRVTVRIEGSSRPDLVEAAKASFLELTGYELHLDWA